MRIITIKIADFGSTIKTGCKIYPTNPFEFILKGIILFVVVKYKTSGFLEEIPLQEFGEQITNHFPCGTVLG